ncbi:MAG: CoB--CoM heterodisulfide reductase iron-sulfur subunit B family protein [Dehalococcoidales bacterium]|nr:MAG: CoB--CoM heterodisulfide reductase iron-sulfur subunit B family protein [Dehalococcoidales bacterium]
MKYAYYPGCTATSTSIEYEESVRELAGYLDIEFTEIPDWTCCGASSGHVINRELSLALPSRNLALAEMMSLDVVAPCPGCLLRFKTAEYELGRDSALKSKIEEDIGLSLNLSQKSHHVLEILYQDIGIDTIREKVVRPLDGLKVAPYYGCVLVRPPEVTSFDNPENPVAMDEIMEALGADIVDWSYKVDCCGGSLSIVVPEIVQKLSGKIIQGAREAGADMIVTACGICQLNLDMRQPKEPDTEPVPALYFSELMAHAFGSQGIKGWAGKHFIDPSRTLSKLGLL